MKLCLQEAEPGSRAGSQVQGGCQTGSEEERDEDHKDYAEMYLPRNELCRKCACSVLNNLMRRFANLYEKIRIFGLSLLAFFLFF